MANEQPISEQERAELERLLHFSAAKEKAVGEVENALNSTLQAIRAKAEEYRGMSSRQRSNYNWAKSLAITLGVLTPTFVAFQAQAFLPTWDFYLGLVAVVLTATTGIVSGLQASFKWGEGYARAAMASLQLDGLANQTHLQILLHRTSIDTMAKYQKLYTLNEEAMSKYLTINNTFVNSEITEVTEISTKGQVGSPVRPQLPSTTSRPPES